jgi:acyl-coenzyme A thioesterase PaaI-like protein
MAFSPALKEGRIICRSAVFKPGKQFTVVESEIFCAASETENLVFKATVTITVITR